MQIDVLSLEFGPTKFVLKSSCILDTVIFTSWVEKLHCIKTAIVV